jgi:hypothetical protein
LRLADTAPLFVSLTVVATAEISPQTQTVIMSENTFSKGFTELWAAAINSYQEKANVDLDEMDALDAFLACKTVDDVVRTLEGEMSKYKAFREGDPKWAKLRERAKTTIRVVLVLNNTIGELADSLVRGTNCLL